jgi:hypothetical protein
MPQRQLAADLGLSRPRLRRDGTVVVHSDEAGYRAATRLSATASELIGTYLHVITDDVPSATDVREMGPPPKLSTDSSPPWNIFDGPPP